MQERDAELDVPKRFVVCSAEVAQDENAEAAEKSNKPNGGGPALGFYTDCGGSFGSLSCRRSISSLSDLEPFLVCVETDSEEAAIEDEIDRGGGVC